MRSEPQGSSQLRERKLDPNRPNHVAVIMDGNGRWATERGLKRSDGHRQGVTNLREVVRAFAEQGVSYVTLYAFSTENWSRPDTEVQNLFGILTDYVSTEIDSLHGEGVRILHIGNKNDLPSRVRDAISLSEDMTSHNKLLTLSVAFNYGGKEEIINAVKQIIKEGVSIEDVNESTISERLYTSEIPNPDLIVRTAGEMRLSNFLIWQSAYSEYYSTNVLWPDFSPNDVNKAIEAYSFRRRKFGRLDH